jgi:predicted transglutaminase-like cysteine proteinase
MYSFRLKAYAAGAAICGAALLIQPTNASAPNARYMEVGGETSVPFGWIDFCARYDGECAGGRLPAADIQWTGRAQADFERVNHWVNANVAPLSDRDHWGVVDRWDYPADGRGDCEDYALLKRKMLIEMGYPRQALLLTVVKDRDEDGHALLTVRTSDGDYALDNLGDDLKRWSETGYRFVKRQSQEDQNLWVTLGEPTRAPLYTAR